LSSIDPLEALAESGVGSGENSRKTEEAAADASAGAIGDNGSTKV